MAPLEPTPLYKLQLTDEEFKQLSTFIYNESGIKLPPVKKVMLQCRLQKRLKELNMSSFKEYCDYVFGHEEDSDYEIINMLDVVSTNKTDFFREPQHFNYLATELLPAFYQANRGQTFHAWSAGCSSGEEPYTLAIVMHEFLSQNHMFDYTIDATDLSTKILQTATNAVYPEARVEGIPLSLKHKYLLRSKNRDNPTVKIAPLLRQRINFARLNLMNNSYATKHTYHLIMCRNVLIYFDRPTQEKVIKRLCDRLQPDGYLMLGHSESILNMDVPLKQVQPTVYCKNCHT